MHLTEKFSCFYQAGQSLCLDKSLLLYKGQLSFKQYIPSKRSRFTLKFFFCVMQFLYKKILNIPVMSDSSIIHTALLPDLLKDNTKKIPTVQPKLFARDKSWIESNFISADSNRKCCICSQTFSKTTGQSTLFRHNKNKHLPGQKK